jgi:hypothetical protein
MSEIDDLRKQLKTLQDKVSKQEKTSTDTKVSPGVDFKQNYVTSFSVDPREIKKTIDGVISSVMDGFGDGGILGSTAMSLLDEQATQISNSFGISKGRMEELRQVIADASPELIKMGLDQTEVAQNYGAIAKEMGGAASLGTEAIIDMSAAAKVSGQDVGILAKEFRNVGISLYDVGEQMKDVANYARSVGVSVSAVSAGVVGNINKLNLYNFEGGVNGLAKMAAQASRLGVNMGTVFKIADDLFSPEKAIDMSAALQRLGVTSSGLLDPLRAMDMAQNDPAALQNEIVNISKEFTKFNEVSGKMEILPGSKRRLREVAEAIGVLPEELANMSIKAADFDKKMSQIKLPSFAEGNQETKELIASMAQMKGGVATINVKDEKTGEVLLKQVDQLTPEDIEKLKNSQAEQGKSVEELAVDQLTQLQQINFGINGMKASAAFGKATSEPVEKLFGAMMNTQNIIARDYGGRSSTKAFRDTTSTLVQPVEDYITSGIKGDKKGQQDSLEKLASNLVTMEQEQLALQQKYFEETVKNIQQGFKDSYEKPKEVKTTSDVNLNMNINGNDNVRNMDLNSIKDEIIKFLTGTSEGKALLKQAVENKNAPSAATGPK